MSENQTEQPSQTSAPGTLSNEELYLVVRAQQGQIRELINFTEELNGRLKKWEMFFGDKFSGVFAGEVGTVTDEQLKPVELPEAFAAGFGALLRGEQVAGNAPPSQVPLPAQDTEPKFIALGGYDGEIKNAPLNTSI